VAYIGRAEREAGAYDAIVHKEGWVFKSLCGAVGWPRVAVRGCACARFQIVGLGHCHTHTDADVVKARLNSVTVDQEFSPSVNSAGGRA